MNGQLVKARFQIYNKTTKKFGSALPVLINPSDITVVTSNKTQEKSSTGEQEKEDTVLSEGATRKTLKMLLHFDIVNQYNQMVKKSKDKLFQQKAEQVLAVFDSDGSFLEKAGGAFQALQSQMNFTQFNVLSEKLCCLNQLQEAAIQKSQLAFMWGAMQYVGIISDFSIKFTYFSNQGAPLRAEVNITMECAPTLPKEAETSMKAEKAKLDAKSKRPSPA